MIPPSNDVVCYKDFFAVVVHHPARFSLNSDADHYSLSRIYRAQLADRDGV